SALDTPKQDSGHTVDLTDARAQEEKVESGEKQIVDGRSIKEVDQLADVPRVLTPGLQPGIPSPPVRLDLVPVPPQVQLNGSLVQAPGRQPLVDKSEDLLDRDRPRLLALELLRQLVEAVLSGSIRIFGQPAGRRHLGLGQVQVTFVDQPLLQPLDGHRVENGGG